MAKYLNQLIVFILELLMLGILGFYGFQKGSNTLTKYAFAILLPAIVILLWGYFAAPKSAHRLPMPYLAMFRGLCFLLASYALYKSNQPSAALIIAFLSVSTQLTSLYFGD
jgi:hypothetical protein